MKTYETYKPSGIEWIGEIPSHWEINQMRRGLSLLTDYDANGSFSTIKSNVNRVDNEEEKYAWLVRATDLEQNKNINKTSNEIVWVNFETWNFLSKSYLSGGELLIAKRGEIGKIYLMPFTEFPATLGPNMYLARLINQKINPIYAFYFFSVDLGVNQLKIRNKSTTIGALYKDDFKDIIFIFPPPEEQTTIATYLDRKTAEIDALIADKKRLLALYEEEKTALINQAVTKGLDPTVPMKDSGIEWLGDVPGHWEVKRFDSLFSFSRGLSITKADLQDTGIPCVSYGEIHSKYGFEVDPKKHSLKCVKEEYLETNNKSLLEFGDFVFADTSEDIEGSGNFTYLNSDVSTFAGYHTIIGKPKMEFERRYVAYFFNSLNYRNQIRSKVTGTKVYSITQAILKFTNIIFPTIQEQKIIIEFIDKECSRIDTKIAKTKTLIDLLTEYRTALISEVVTGKVKVV